jgi:hypothetical protein
MFSWVGGLMDRLCAVAGALIFAQIPLFIQQYTQQLVGRQAELQLQSDLMRQSARLSGKTVEQLAQKFIESADQDIVRQGEMMLATINRWTHLSEALNAMQQSSIWSKPVTFLYHINSDVVLSSWKHFKFGLPFTIEGGIYAVFGTVFSCLCFALLKSLGKRIIGIKNHGTLAVRKVS